MQKPQSGHYVRVSARLSDSLACTQISNSLHEIFYYPYAEETERVLKLETKQVHKKKKKRASLLAAPK